MNTQEVKKVEPPTKSVIQLIKKINLLLNQISRQKTEIRENERLLVEINLFLKEEIVAKNPAFKKSLILQKKIKESLDIKKNYSALDDTKSKDL